ncbi:MAG: DUF2934 domain-containing protein [Beijerinckiaceae bacterium]|jgi:hypothetical protein
MIGNGDQGPHPFQTPTSPEEDERRVREHAYRLWGEEGRPEGRDKTHWRMAREKVAAEDGFRDALKPSPSEECVNIPTPAPNGPFEPARKGQRKKAPGSREPGA